MIYFLCIALFVRHGTFFFFVWLFLGVVALGLSFCMKRGIWQEHVPLLVRKSFWCVATIGVLFFLIVEGFILSGFGMSGSDQAKYLVVLGAQMKPEGPSKVLQYRLDAALAYLTDHPECQVVVSGGQGADEHISEAQGMYDYLVAHGLETDRILLEDQSVNTVQNLAFSAKYFDKEKCIIKITPIHETVQAVEEGYEIVHDFDVYERFEEPLVDAGWVEFEFVPSKEEDEDRITCGNSLISMI